MTLLLNGGSVPANHYPAAVDLFSDAGAFCHMLIGALAGSELLSAKDSVILLSVFTGYQLSQAQAGEPWSRIGGELIEFALGMLLMRLMPLWTGAHA